MLSFFATIVPYLLSRTREASFARQTFSAPGRSRIGIDLRLARGRGRVQKARAGLVDRQGFGRAPASGAQGILSGQAAVPAAAHRYEVEVPGDDRVPGRDREAPRARSHRLRARG